MYLQKKKNTSNNSKHQFSPVHFYSSEHIFFYFFKKKKNINFGKNISKQWVVFTKKAPLYFKYNINKNISWNKQTALIINFKHIACKNIFYLIKYANGSVTLIKSIFGTFIGNFLNFFFLFFKQYRFPYIGWQCILRFIPRFIFISNINIQGFKNIFFSVSSGCYSQVIEVYKDLNLIEIRLSSGVKKILHEETIVTLGRNNNIFQKYSILGSYSWKYYLGKKSIVRGVAMNPVDHPHGGRTKTNKPEVSPWNWVTKHSH